MKYILLLLFSLIVLPVHVSGQDVPALTNNDIMDLVKEGFGDDLIIGQIKVQKNGFVVDLNAMRSLKQAGVSEAIINEMMAAAADPRRKATDPNDIMSPHRPGIYIHRDGRLSEFLPSTLPLAKTRGAIGNRLSQGWAKETLVIRMPGTRSDNHLQAPIKLYFYFGDQVGLVDQHQMAHFGFGSTGNPREFSLVRMLEREGGREVEVASSSNIGQERGMESGQILSFSKVEQLKAGVYEVELPPLPAGEYCIVHSRMASWSADHHRVYDFHVSNSATYPTAQPPPVKSVPPSPQGPTPVKGPSPAQGSRLSGVSDQGVVGGSVSPVVVEVPTTDRERTQDAPGQGTTDRTLDPKNLGPLDSGGALVTPQHEGCVVVLERANGAITHVRSDEVTFHPKASTTGIRLAWSGRDNDERSLWVSLVPRSGTPPLLVRATLVWADGRRMVIASEVRSPELEIRPDGSRWHRLKLNSQEWKAVRTQLPNELLLVTKAGPLDAALMATERNDLEEAGACVDASLISNGPSTTSANTYAANTIDPPLPVLPAQPSGFQPQVDGSPPANTPQVDPATRPDHEPIGGDQDHQAKPVGSLSEVGLAYRVLTEQPERFDAVGVYTVLHVFSSPNALDTFRVVSRNGPVGGLTHELWISTIPGATYREQLFPVPLAGAKDAGKNAGEEMEMLRVRMALAPGAFQTNPISVDDWRLSGSRASRDLLYDLSIAEFETVFFEKPAIGFHFQSDAETRRELVYSNTLRRIVNVAPQ